MKYVPAPDVLNIPKTHATNATKTFNAPKAFEPHPSKPHAHNTANANSASNAHNARNACEPHASKPQALGRRNSGAALGDTLGTFRVIMNS
jgi:uncharacterized protein (DUF2342 family)